MKKLILMCLLLVITMGLMACNSNTDNEDKAATKEESTATPKEESNMVAKTITIKVANAEGKEIDLIVPFDPKRIVVVDYVALDMLDSWGLADRVLGMPKSQPMHNLDKYRKDDTIVNIGTLKDIDMEAIMSLNPDIIFSSGRAMAKYNELSKIAPTVMTRIDYKIGTLKSFEKFGLRNASIFGLEDKFNEQLAAFKTRVVALQKIAKDKTAIITLITGGSIKTLGNDSRGSMIANDIGFKNLAANIDSTHGNISSFELFVKLDPEYIFVLDKDTAIAAEGAASTKEFMNNELIMQTQAYKNDKIVYLTPTVWYLTEGGVSAMDTMLQDLEQGTSPK